MKHTRHHWGDPRLPYQLSAAIFSRFCLNTARRFPYPFASALAVGIGIPLTTATSMIALTQLTTLLGLFVVPLADRHGTRKMMLAALFPAFLGIWPVSIFPFTWVLFAAVFLSGLGKTIFDPVLGAFIGARVPYERRGLVVGISETSWSGASLLGIPLMGFLMDRFSWKAPFIGLAVAFLIGMLLLYFLIPTERASQQTLNPSIKPDHPWGRLFRSRPALGMLGLGVFMSIATDNLFITYGIWLEKSFGLSLAALGAATTVIGLAELSGEGLTATISDRLGLRRVLWAGLGISAGSYFLLIPAGQSPWFAGIALFIIFVSFEFSIVTSFAVCTEIFPEARATMMAGFFAAMGLGRVIGGLIGGHIWLASGIGGIAVISAGTAVIGLGSCVWGLRAWRR